MRNAFFIAALSCLLAAASGCAGGGQAANAPQASRPASPASSPETMNWAFAPKALEITFVSDPFLNEYEGAAHSLTACIYQLEDPEDFGKLAASAPGVSKLLDCGGAGVAGVVAARRVTVQPGRNETVVLDRGEKARFVAVACGYYDLNQGAVTQVYEIPVSADTSGWLWWKETSYQPAKLARKIILGRAGMLPAAP